MSLSFKYVALQASDTWSVDMLLKDRDLLIPLESNTPGWRWWKVTRHLSVEWFDELLERMSSSADGPSLGLHVETSDYAYISAVASGRAEARLLIDTSGAKELSEGSWVLEMCRREYGRQWMSEGAKRFATWSGNAPTALTRDQVLSTTRKHWLFPEEALEEIALTLGLPMPTWTSSRSRTVYWGIEHDPTAHQEAKVAHTFGRGTVNGIEFDLARADFVLGTGEGFVGIWDRREEGPPLQRFSDDAEGRSQASEAWFNLVTNGIPSWRLWAIRKQQKLARERQFWPMRRPRYV